MSITLLKGIPKLAKKGWKKRKILTISGSPTPKKGEVIIKKPSKTKLADTWQGRRIDAMNRKLKKTRGRSTEDYAQEAADIYKSKEIGRAHV